MKNTLFLFTCILFCLIQKTSAQIVNWNSLNNKAHVIKLGFAWDYALSSQIGYAYRFNTKTPLLISGNLSIPFGKKLFDDIKLQSGGKIVVFNKEHWKASTSLQLLYRRYQNPLVRIQNVGSELSGDFGYYHKKYFVALELGFDQPLFTHFRHFDAFRENIFQDVKDGWYPPDSGGKISYGIQTGFSINKSDLTASIGMISNTDFKTAPLIPYFLTIGYNYRI